MQAYSRLTGDVAYNSAQEAVDTLLDTMSELKSKHGWPRCLGYLAVPTDIDDYEFEWTDMAEAATVKGQTQNALLLEYIPGLEAVNFEMLNETLVEDILNVLAQLQEEGINHRANINPAVWPKPGIRNIYVCCPKPGSRCGQYFCSLILSGVHMLTRSSTIHHQLWKRHGVGRQRRRATTDGNGDGGSEVSPETRHGGQAVGG